MRPYVFRLSDEVYDMLKSMTEKGGSPSGLVSFLIEREYVNRLQERAGQVRMKNAISAIHAVAERNR